MNATITRPPLRYHGGKWRAAPHIIKHFPPHMTYVEPFGGGAGVLLRKQRSKNEIYNDLDGDIVNVFQVLRDDIKAKELLRQISLTPFSRGEMLLAWEDGGCDIERARKTLVRSHMGFGSAGATKGRTGFRGLDVYEGSYSAPAMQWKRLPYHLWQIIERLRGVVIENTDALKIINQADYKNTLFYCDPPYMFESRSSMKSGQKYYRHEMTDTEHEELLKRLLALKGDCVISGYRTDLYCDMLNDWDFVTFDSRASSKAGTVIRQECLWIKPTKKTTLF